MFLVVVEEDIVMRVVKVVEDNQWKEVLRMVVRGDTDLVGKEEYLQDRPSMVLLEDMS